jgi:hypothetical protein
MQTAPENRSSQSASRTQLLKIDGDPTPLPIAEPNWFRSLAATKLRGKVGSLCDPAALCGLLERASRRRRKPFSFVYVSHAGSSPIMANDIGARGRTASLRQ